MSQPAREVGVALGTQLGELLGRLLGESASPAERELVAASVELLYRERALGHVCIALADWAGSPMAELPRAFPDAAAWRAALLGSGAATPTSAGDDLAPLVIDAANRLYLRRDHATEAAILLALQTRLAEPLPIAPERVRAALAAQGQLADSDVNAAEPDWQLAAIAGAAASRFLLLTGGPGTGKTTTVARLLALLLEIEPGLRVALCAPTGKAAARLGEALAAHARQQPGLAAALPELQPQTLHRLLRYHPLDDAFRHGLDRPLPHDLVVVDEASMLDPALLAVLLAALRDSARLLLVGDRDQLAAVAAGQVLGDLCRAAAPERGTGPRLANFAAAATGMALPVQANAPAIADAVVALRTNHRFGAQPGLDHFARALALRDPDRALQVLDEDHADLAVAADPDVVIGELEAELLAAARATPEAAIAGLGRLRILAATRHGDAGTLAWNRRIEARLARHGIRVDDPWYRGRPVLVTANDHQNRIYNGDLGVVCRDDSGRAQVAFPDGKGGIRLVSTFRVPTHETAWAMTVHKAQGSEFDTVVLSMPEIDGPLWQAPLIYTGITRARRRAILIAERSLLRAGLRRWPTRGSGLAEGLLR